MSRSVVLACLCALPCAGLLRQAESADSYAATLAEMARPGAIDPVDPPRDHLGDSITRAASTLDRPDSPSDRGGLLSLPRPDLRSGPVPGPHRDSAGPAPPADPHRHRPCWLQVFRN